MTTLEPHMEKFLSKITEKEIKVLQYLIDINKPNKITDITDIFNESSDKITTGNRAHRTIRQNNQMG